MTNWGKVRNIHKAKGRSTLKEAVWEPKVPMSSGGLTTFAPNHSGVHKSLEVKGDTILEGDLCFVRGGGLPYAEISAEGASSTHAVATGVWHQVDVFNTDGLSNLCTPDHTENHITIVKAGVYKVNVSIAFSGTGGVDWMFSLFKNNGSTEFPNVHTNRKLGSGGDIGSASMCGLVTFAVGDTVEVWGEHGAGVNKDLVMQDCNISLSMLGS